MEHDESHPYPKGSIRSAKPGVLSDMQLWLPMKSCKSGEYLKFCCVVDYVPKMLHGRLLFFLQRSFSFFFFVIARYLINFGIVLNIISFFLLV